MMRVASTVESDVFAELRLRGPKDDAATQRIVAEIIDDVRTRGDAALLDSARKYDAPDLLSLRPGEDEFAAARSLPAAHRDALELAAARVLSFHQSQMEWVSAGLERRPGPGFEGRWSAGEHGEAGQRVLALARAGVYVPGGGANYPSSVLMNALPAKAAGVPSVAVTTPARRDGTLHPAILLALDLVGTREVYKVGGAAAVAALALGTESIRRVDKIVGPGNRFVNEAKRQLWGKVGLDGYAGPSEVAVLVDGEANAQFAAADLLTQVEHAPDNAGFLVSTCESKLREVLAEVERQLQGAPREAVLRQALAEQGLAVLARDLAEAIDVVNEIAPEHLTLAIKDPERALESVRNAGCVLLGEFTPESAGDFCLGPSHTLPTSGAARWQSPVNALDFLKIQSLAHLTRAQVQGLIPTIEAFGEMEGFPAHARGATVRKL